MKIKHFALAMAASLGLLLPVAAPALQDGGNAQSEAGDHGDDTASGDPASEPADAGADALAEEGAVLFSQRCGGCHSADTGQPSYGGPNLAGVVGRPAASAQFRYSAALRASGLTWSAEEMDSYIAAPGTKVPGSSMVISLPDAAQRAAVIAFLATTAQSE